MLETSRLKLVPLTHEQLILYKNNPASLAENLRVEYKERHHDPATANDLKEAIEFWIENTRLHREHFRWYTNWEIIVKTDNVGIGGIGFAGLPDAEGRSMVGYGLDMRYHGHGFATEALQAIIAWGFSHDALQKIIADTPLHHLASQRVLTKNNFIQMSQDDIFLHWQLLK